MNNLQPGTVTIKWDKYSSHTDIDAFYVRKEAIEDLYALIGETSSRSILKNVRETIIRLMERSSVDWLKDGYYRDMLTKVDRGTLPKVDCDFDRILNMVCAALSGFLIPIILEKLNIDPALASSVFVTTVTDCLGFFFFLGLATIAMPLLR